MQTGRNIQLAFAVFVPQKERAIPQGIPEFQRESAEKNRVSETLGVDTKN